MTRVLDSKGKRLQVGDRVRVLGVPDLSGMAERQRAESGRVFKRIVGTFKRIRRFDRRGNAELVFRIMTGSDKGLHVVGIEPQLLERRRGIRVSSLPAYRLWNGPASRAKRQEHLEERDWCDWGTLAQKSYRRGRWKEALACLSKAIRLNPLDTVSRESYVGDLMMKADCLRRLGRIREAVRCERDAGGLRRLFSPVRRGRSRRK